MMLNPADLRLLRKEIFEMAAPQRRVLAGPSAGRPGVVEHRLDAPADPAGSLGFLGPDGFERLHHEPDIDRLHGE